jgi:hypothetical protein
VSDALSLSTPLLAIRIDALEPGAEEGIISSPFASGKYRIYPNVRKEIKQNEDLYIYTAVYNAALNQPTLRPELEASYQIIDSAGQVLVRHAEPDWTNAGKDCYEIVKVLKAVDLNSGSYKLVVEVKDRITGTSTHSESNFKVVN